MNNQEYEPQKRECWEEFRTHVVCGTDNPKGWFERAFDRAYALGKQEKDAEETVIHGWVARDKSGDLYMYHTKPLRNVVADRWRGESSDIDLYNNLLFSDLTWESDPEEVEIIIKRKKK